MIYNLTVSSMTSGGNARTRMVHTVRLGEMERDVIIAHGMAHLLKERLVDSSDIYSYYICDRCGLPAQKIFDKDIYECKVCNNKTDISKITVPYAMKLFFQEMMAVSIAPRIRTAKSKFADTTIAKS